MLVRGKLLLCALSFALIAPGQPALAQVPEIAVGAVVNDMTGREVGTVTAVNGPAVLVKTDRHEVQLPVGSMAPHNGAFLIAMSREQLNAAVDQVLAAAQPNPTQSVGAGAVENASVAPTPQQPAVPPTPVSAPQPR
jgi:hypothetical protein